VFGRAVGEAAPVGALPVRAKDVASGVKEAAFGSARDMALGSVPERGAVALQNAVGVAPEAFGADGAGTTVAGRLGVRLGGGGVTGRLVRGRGPKLLAGGWGAGSAAVERLDTLRRDAPGLGTTGAEGRGTLGVNQGLDL
jgi:hypothetical protein